MECIWYVPVYYPCLGDAGQTTGLLDEGGPARPPGVDSRRRGRASEPRPSATTLLPRPATTNQELTAVTRLYPHELTAVTRLYPHVLPQADEEAARRSAEARATAGLTLSSVHGADGGSEVGPHSGIAPKQGLNLLWTTQAHRERPDRPGSGGKRALAVVGCAYADRTKEGTCAACRSLPRFSWW